MKFITDILSGLMRVAFIAILAMGLSGCGSDDSADEPLPPTGGNMQATPGVNAGFILTVGDNATASAAEASRAPAEPEGGYDPGAGYENYINVPDSNFRFLFFDERLCYVGRFTVSDIVAVSGNPISKRYQVLGGIDKDVVSGRVVTVVALANWPSYPDLAEGDHISRLWTDPASRFTFSAESMQLSPERAIPLYGVREYAKGELSFDPNNFTNLGTIHLLRAYAKVKVECHTEGWTLNRVALTRYHSIGASAPKNVTRQEHYVHNDYWSDYVNTPNIPVKDDIRQDLPFMKVDDGVFVAYMPEFDIIGSAKEDRARLAVEFDESVSVYYIDFMYYNPPVGVAQYTPFDILRNYYYQFDINKIPEWGDLRPEIDVQPYASADLAPEFGFLRDDDNNIVDADGNILWKKP